MLEICREYFSPLSSDPLKFCITKVSLLAVRSCDPKWLPNQRCLMMVAAICRILLAYTPELYLEGLRESNIPHTK